ncbi:MAG: glutathione S-transferase N-terminal domain-containing protein [Bdellovibrionaceae bacterium]|jgi:GST-like protein|nr:glutathione S-transferase N-terminal domain-containing protein [Pseudobdellovibrionaceae bacterium]
MNNEIQLYSFATPNGQKISIALEEMGLPYTPHTVNIIRGDQFKPEFVQINPNSKIPAIIDPSGPDGKPISIMESGAILMYLAQKSGLFWPTDPRLQSEVLQWLFFQVGGVGPMFGQFGHFFKYAVDKCDHPYPLERYATESRRILGVLEARLEGRQYLVGEHYTIADMATVPWVNSVNIFYKASDKLELTQFKNVMAWVQRILSRPKTAAGMNVCAT